MGPNLQPAGAVTALSGLFGATDSWTGIRLASSETPEPVSRTFGEVPMHCSLLLPLPRTLGRPALSISASGSYVSLQVYAAGVVATTGALLT